MQDLQNSFPVYVSGQYLTSENLNATQNFLWQQENATRYILSGNGIAHGLDISFADSTSLKQITVSAGDACTPDGYIIQLNATQVFDKGFAIKLTLVALEDGSEVLMEKATFDNTVPALNAIIPEIDAFEIFSTSTDITALPDGTTALSALPVTPSDISTAYLLLAWVFIKDVENDNCIQGDCNTKGILRNYITRYFLAPNNLFTQHNSLLPEIPTCIATRIKNLSQSGSTMGFYQASSTAWNFNITELQPYFSADNSQNLLSVVAGLLDATAQSAYTNSIAMFTQITQSADATNCPQYYNAFASDLSKAINELVIFYNDYIKKYPVYATTRIESVIMFGGFTPAAIDSWRYYFIPSTEQVAFTFDKYRLEQLFVRAVALVNNFIIRVNLPAQAAKINAVLAIQTTAGDGSLANRSIPYYYDVLTGDTNNDVLKTWSPQGGNLQNIFCYYDALIPARAGSLRMLTKLANADWTNDTFFRIEGHVGKAKADAISAVSTLILNNDLPIQLLDCDVDYKGPIDWYNWYLNFSSFLLNKVQALKAANPNQQVTKYGYDPLKKISTSIQQTSYRQPDQVKSIVNDFVAYSNVFYKSPLNAALKPMVKKNIAVRNDATKKVAKKAAPQITKAAVRNEAVQVNSNSLLDAGAISTYVNTISQTEFTAQISNYYTAVNQVADPTVKKLIVLKDLVGLEYMGGVPFGGTFILLHSNGTVVGDGCLPYYYRIDQGRVFSQ